MHHCSSLFCTRACTRLFSHYSLLDYVPPPLHSDNYDLWLLHNHAHLPFAPEHAPGYMPPFFFWTMCHHLLLRITIYDHSPDLLIECSDDSWLAQMTRQCLASNTDTSTNSWPLNWEFRWPDNAWPPILTPDDSWLLNWVFRWPDNADLHSLSDSDLLWACDPMPAPWALILCPLDKRYHISYYN